MMPEEDRRSEIYRDLHANYLVREEHGNRASARRVLEVLFGLYRPESMLDVGCGLGTWISVARSLGVGEVMGLEGPWLDRSRLVVEDQSVRVHDLAQPFELGRRFDLVISLEVAEHLPESSAEGFVDSLVRHGGVVLFSAAIPQQGGHGHRNEQWPGYWARLFAARGHECTDLLRPVLWQDPRVYSHLRQNLLLYVSGRRRLEPPFAGVATGLPAPLVHPEIYNVHFNHLDQWKEAARRYERLVTGLARGGDYRVSLSQGDIRLTRIDPSPAGRKTGVAETPILGPRRKESSTLRESTEEEIRRGEELFEDGELHAALRFFESALEKDPDNLRALNDKGVVLHWLGRGREASEIFLQVLGRDPAHEDARANLVSACRSLAEQSASIPPETAPEDKPSAASGGGGAESGRGEEEYCFWRSQERVVRVLGKTLFFVIGCPKSGTTWLQYLLDAHPQIRCTGEADFNLLMSMLNDLGNRYNGHIRDVNSKIGTENYTAFSQETLRFLFVSAIAELLGAQGLDPAIRCIGSKNPVLIDAMEVYAKLLPRARYVHIVRDGRDVVTSAWFNNLRANEKLTRSKWPEFSTFVDYGAQLWASMIKKARNAGRRMPGRYHEVSYERLHAEPHAVIQGILGFLGVDASDPVVDLCVRSSSFQTLSRGRERGEEDQGSFFRKGVVGDWKNHFDNDSLRSFMAHAGGSLEEMGYT